MSKLRARHKKRFPSRELERRELRENLYLMNNPKEAVEKPLSEDSFTKFLKKGQKNWTKIYNGHKPNLIRKRAWL